MAATEYYYRFAFRAMADISGTILVPVFAAVLLRYWFDLEGLGFVIILNVTLIATAVVLVKKVRAYGKAFRQLIESEPPRDGSTGS